MKSSVLALLVWISVTIVPAMATGPGVTGASLPPPAAEMVTVTLLSSHWPSYWPSSHLRSAQHSQLPQHRGRSRQDCRQGPGAGEGAGGRGN